jgi:acyl dehydratase
MNVLKSPHFEDFSAGQTITTMRRTIAEADMLGFVQLTGLFEELWLDAGKARATGLYTGRLVPGYLTLSFGEGLFVLSGWMRNAVGMLGVDEVKWLAPVACGDTIRCEIEVVKARPSKDPARGVVVMQHRVLNQDDMVVLQYRSARLIASSSTASDAEGS